MQCVEDDDISIETEGGSPKMIRNESLANSAAKITALQAEHSQAGLSQIEESVRKELSMLPELKVQDS